MDVEGRHLQMGVTAIHLVGASALFWVGSGCDVPETNVEEGVERHHVSGHVVSPFKDLRANAD